MFFVPGAPTSDVSPYVTVLFLSLPIVYGANSGPASFGGLRMTDRIILVATS